MDTNEKNCAVLLTDAQEVKVIRCDPGTDTFDVACNVIGCEWIEIVEPEPLAKDDMVLLIDEEGKLKSSGFINCIASYLYGSDKHGDAIVGSGVVVKAADESLELMTNAEAKQLAFSLTQIRATAIDKMAEAFRLQPRPKRQNEVRDVIKASAIAADCHDRQPCKPKEPER